VTATVEELINPGEKLVPLARLDQARSKRMLSQAAEDDTPLAELSIDDVTVLRPGAEGWEPVSQFHEMEIELAPGAERSALKEVALAVRDLPGVAADDQNKLQQALAALADAPISEDTPADHCLHVAELCRRVWRQQLAQMVIHEAGVRFSKDIEFVHEMRVATRRARAAAKLYAGFFERKNKRIKRFVRDLRTTGRLLGSVRDMDVALDKLDRYAAECDSEKDKGTEDLRHHWKKTRDKAHESLLDWLDSPRYAMFVSDFGRFCETPGDAITPFDPVPGEPPEPHQVRHVIPSMILNRYESIRAFEVLFERDEAGKPDVPVETLHALRIECKYLRYHLEFNAALLGPEGQELIASLKALQDHLGNLNDASVSARMLDEADKHVRGDLLRGYRTLQEQTVEELRTSLPADLKEFLSEETRRTLTLAVARI
jgi:CHAD domain-containing protein